MFPTKLRDDQPPADPEQLRRHLGGPPLEHPAPRSLAAPAPSSPRGTPRATDSTGSSGTGSSVTGSSGTGSSGTGSSGTGSSVAGISVMEWVLAIGYVVARRLRRQPPASPMVQLHPPE
jgi:hypothetical protein